VTEDEVREVVTQMTTESPSSSPYGDRPGGGVFNVCVILEFRDGKIARETRYYAEPFQAPAGSAQWRLPTEE
jgi:ketosteroid isomerase-like protein